MIFFADGLLCVCCFLFTQSEFLRVRNRSRMGGPLYPVLWAILALVLGLLALQEVTGLLNGITDSARHDAITEGWYRDRRPFQWLLIKMVPIIALTVGLGALWAVRNAWRRYGLVLAAILYWVSYAGIEGISFHNIDWLLRQHTDGIQNKTWGDLVGMALTAIAMLIAWQMDQGHPSAASEVPPKNTWFGRIRRSVWRERQSFLAEMGRWTDWYQRLRTHRQKRTPRPKTPNRRK